MSMIWILTGICLLLIGMGGRYAWAVMAGMAVGAMLVLVMLFAGCDAASIELVAAALACAALWRSRRDVV